MFRRFRIARLAPAPAAHPGTPPSHGSGASNPSADTQQRRLRCLELAVQTAGPVATADDIRQRAARFADFVESGVSR